MGQTLAEINGGGIVGIKSRARHFPDTEAKIHGLAKHLIVKNEIVRIFQDRNSFQYFSAESTVPGIVFRKFVMED
jgi:hypothetical protein